MNKIQLKTERSRETKLPQDVNQEKYDQTGSISLRREERQKCTVVSSREERENTPETTEQETVENGETIYTCKVCKKEFHREYSLRIHSRSHTRCKGCLRGVLPRDLMSHNRLCKKLKKVLAREADENLMLMTKKDRRTQMYSCPYCVVTSSSRNKFLRHMHHHLLVRPFACSVCQKNYCNTQALEKHMLIHQDERKSAETNGDMTWTMPLEDTEEASVSPSKDSSSIISSNDVERGPSQGDEADSQMENNGGTND